MLKTVFAATLLLTSTASFASFYDMCQFDATITGITQVADLGGTVTHENRQVVAVVSVSAAEDLGGHTDCQGYIGRLHVLQLDDEELQEYRVGDELTLHYDTLNGLTPDGIWERTTWTVVEETPSDLFEAPAEILAGSFDALANEIVLDVEVGGGCGDHFYQLEVGLCLETFPVQCRVVLKHTTNDACRALIRDTARISLEDAGLTDGYYNGAYLTIEGANGSTASLQLPLSN